MKPEDILAVVEINDANIGQIPGSPNYRVFTENGFMQLDDCFHDKLIEELVALAEAQK